MKLFAMRRLRQFDKADEGQALALMASALLVLTLIACLDLDVFLPYQKQQMQKAADTDAGASERVHGTPALAVVAANNHTAANGLTNDNNGIAITANNPPKTGLFINNIEYVEVIIAHAQSNITVSHGVSESLAGVCEEESGKHQSSQEGAVRRATSSVDGGNPWGI